MTGAARDALDGLADAVSLWRITPAAAKDVIDAATDALVAGLKSPSLGILAGRPAPRRKVDHGVGRLSGRSKADVLHDQLAGVAGPNACDHGAGLLAGPDGEGVTVVTGAAQAVTVCCQRSLSPQPPNVGSIIVTVTDPAWVGTLRRSGP